MLSYKFFEFVSRKRNNFMCGVRVNKLIPGLCACIFIEFVPYLTVSVIGRKSLSSKAAQL